MILYRVFYLTVVMVLYLTFMSAGAAANYYLWFKPDAVCAIASIVVSIVALSSLALWVTIVTPYPSEE